MSRGILIYVSVAEHRRQVRELRATIRALQEVLRVDAKRVYEAAKKLDLVGVDLAAWPTVLRAIDETRKDALLVALANRAECAALEVKRLERECRAGLSGARVFDSTDWQLARARADAYFVALAEADRALASRR